MGLKYLKSNYSWSEVTREERFFCAHLYFLIKEKGLSKFIGYLNNTYNMSLSVDANWEVAYEACFYRDLWHHWDKKGKLYSKKRTFDLCLLSDDTIIVIEAKSNQEFEDDQVQDFKKDKNRLKEATRVKTVILVGLASSQYDIPQDIRGVFNGPCLTWFELAGLYANDEILLRADDVYEPGSKRSYGRNNQSGHKTGIELLESYKGGANFFVGRSGGLHGKTLSDDLTTGSWKQHRYETNNKVGTAPNENWFRLSDFIKHIGDM